MRKRSIHAALTILLSFLMAHPAFGWGDEGHRIVARIAARHLTVPARKRIGDIVRSVAAGQDDLHLLSLVGPAGSTPSADQIESVLAAIATWPDHMPGGKKETEPWHFIDIGLFEGPTQMAARCPGGACVNQKISDIQKDLKANQPLTRFAPDRELRFLVHFLGDIHQPLHTATNGDAGGNCIKTTGLEPSRELHAVWDTALVDLVIESSETETASAIIKLLDSQQAAFQKMTDPNQMAAESFNIAKNVYASAQPRLTVVPRFIDVTPSACSTQAAKENANVTVNAKASYDNPTTLSVIQQQLYKGGVRLATALNSL